MGSRFARRIARKRGLAPGTVVHVGQERAHGVQLRLMDYDEQHLEERHLDGIADCAVYRGRPSRTWVDLDGIHEVGLILQLGECFGLHPLLLEDVANTEQRPKLDDFDDCLFIVVKMLQPENGGIRTEHVAIVLGKNFVLSFQEVPGDVFEAVRERIRRGRGRIRRMGADYLAYSLLDAVVDGYYPILEKLGERVERIEEELISRPDQSTLREIYRLKQDLLYLRKSVWPLREVAAALQREDSPLIDKATMPFLRDLYDHVIQVMDTVETFRDTIAGMVDIYLSSVSNHMNQVMKVLTMVATIFIPLTFIVGIYGMNFDYMPELHLVWGYPAVLLAMLGVGVGMWLYFKSKSWL